MAESSETEVDSTIRAAADAMSDTVDMAAETASKVAGSAVDAAAHAVDAAQQNISTGYRQLSDLADEMTDKVAGEIKKYPIRTVLLVSAGAVILGFVGGLITSKRS